MVIPHRHDNAALSAAAGHIGMPHGITAAINAWAFAIPQPENTIVFSFTAQLGLLRAPDGGDREVFVQSLLKSDVCGT